jgi:hypothetical protein
MGQLYFQRHYKLLILNSESKKVFREI